MIQAILLIILLFTAPVSARAEMNALWHIWPFDDTPHRKDLSGTRLPAGVVWYDFYLQEVRGKRHLLIRAPDVEAAKAEFLKQERTAQFTRQPFKRPPANWIPSFYVVPACQHLRGILYSERNCSTSVQ